MSRNSCRDNGLAEGKRKVRKLTTGTGWNEDRCPKYNKSAGDKTQKNWESTPYDAREERGRLRKPKVGSFRGELCEAKLRRRTRGKRDF